MVTLATVWHTKKIKSGFGESNG